MLSKHLGNRNNPEKFAKMLHFKVFIIKYNVLATKLYFVSLAFSFQLAGMKTLNDQFLISNLMISLRPNGLNCYYATINENAVELECIHK